MSEAKPRPTNTPRMRSADSYRYAKSRSLMERALQVIPHGIYGHQNPSMLVREAYPWFLARAEGCRIWDVDGNPYIDFLCGYGPIVLGYGHPAVEEAAARQRALCDTMNLPGERYVELAERLIGLTPQAAWVVFAKNGSDVCTWALAVARAATGRSIIAMADHAYHGIHAWCNPLGTGFTDNERADIRTFSWNDIESLERIFTSEPGRVAGVVVTPFRHEAFEPSRLPANGFLEAVRALCDREGAAMIVDDVRAGFRLHLGGSTQTWGVTPDLLCYSKALANGYPLAALIGREPLREAAGSVFMTGTFYTQAVPIAAALATLDVLEREGAIERMRQAGERFCAGLAEQARAHGLAVEISGPPAIPFLTFNDDQGSFERSRTFAAACALEGVFLHPVHNWFLSAAHGHEDIDRALAVTDRAFREVRAQYG